MSNGQRIPVSLLLLHLPYHSCICPALSLPVSAPSLVVRDYIALIIFVVRVKKDFMSHVEKRLFVRFLVSLQCYAVGLAKGTLCLLQKHISCGKFIIELTVG